jgi:hypothetical protein
VPDKACLIYRQKIQKAVMDPEPEVVNEVALSGVLLDHTDDTEEAMADILSDRFKTLVLVISDLLSTVDASQHDWIPCT